VGVEPNPGPTRRRNNRRQSMRKPKRTEPTLVPILSSTAIRSNPFVRVSTTFPSNRQFFPEILWAEAITVIPMNVTGTSGVSYTFIGSSPMYTYGPQVNWTGSFAQNVPAGANYLLSSSAATGAIRAPYELSWCYASIYELEVINAGSTPAYVTMLPSTFPSLSGMSQSQAAEQRGAVQLLMTANTNAASNTLSTTVDWAEVNSINRQEFVNQLQWAQPAGSTPGNYSYLHILAQAFDASSNITLVFKLRAKNKFKFSALNPFTTTVPS